MNLIGMLVSQSRGNSTIGAPIEVSFYEEGIIGQEVKFVKRKEIFRIKYTDVSSVEYHEPSLLSKGSLKVHLRGMNDYKKYLDFSVSKRDAELCVRIRDHINSIVSF